MKKLIFLLFGFAVLLMAACKNSGFKRTKSGLLYKIVSDGKGAIPKNKQFLKFHYSSKIRDSMMATTFGNMPAYAPVDTAVGPIYNPTEIFPMLRKGDSAIVVILADSLVKKQGGLAPFIKPKDKLIFYFKILDVLADEQAVQKDQEASFNAIKAKEETAVQAYLTKNKITAQKTEKGTFVVIDNPGEGVPIDSGKVVLVNYTGRTFDGKVFDSNTDTSFGHAEPYRIVIYGSPAIEGWHDGLKMFKKGGKGKLYIPSMMAYGPNPPRGSKIKPYENMMFDIEIVDVTDAPKPATIRSPKAAADSAARSRK